MDRHHIGRTAVKQSEKQVSVVSPHQTQTAGDGGVLVAGVSVLEVLPPQQEPTQAALAGVGHFLMLLPLGLVAAVAQDSPLCGELLLALRTFLFPCSERELEVPGRCGLVRPITAFHLAGLALVLIVFKVIPLLGCLPPLG